MSVSGLNRIEKKAAFSLASVFGVRMLGLFMILPVFAINGEELDNFYTKATPYFQNGFGKMVLMR